MVVPVVFRAVDSNYDSNSWNLDNQFRMLCHPVLLQLPSLMTGPQLYESIEAFVPLPLPYTLRYVNSTVRLTDPLSHDLTVRVLGSEMLSMH